MIEAPAALAEQAVNTIRMLAVDAVQKARSGHPGLPMGAADMAFVLWTRFLKHHPSHPEWPDRDRFVLSAGHGSMLLYSLLHLSGYPVTLDQIKRFRQWGSITPGHPEKGVTPGVETTTGPLGQGIGNAVGMALAARMLAERFNVPGFPVVNHLVYVLAGDGDMMEGVASEAASLAGHLGLGNLICLYDDNHITIEGPTELAFSEDVAARFAAYGWHVQRIDGHDREEVARAIEAARAEETRPSLICCRTHIAKGSPHKQDRAASHGEPLGEEEVAATKAALGWPAEPDFLVPEQVRDLFLKRTAELEQDYQAWQQMMARYGQAHPDRWELWQRMQSRAVPADLEDQLLAAAPQQAAATRESSGAIIQKAAELLPFVVGGSADLAPSTKTLIKGSGDVGPGAFGGRNLHFGVREHGMAAVINGMALHGGFVPYGATFLVFSDYMRPSIRVAAMMGAQVIYLFTHDSIYVGEDGPTHQPVEHAAALRVIPGLTVIRPADGAEAAMAWTVAIERRNGPTALLLTRQKLAPVDRSRGEPANWLRRGAYPVINCRQPDLILVATGSEVEVAVEAARVLEERGRRVRVVSMPSFELFAAQPTEYRESLLPVDVPKVSIEAGASQGWRDWVGGDGLVISQDEFGHSAPAGVLAEQLGFTADKVAERICRWIGC